MSGDAFLGVLLLLAVPADALWRGRRGAVPPSRVRRYLRSIAVAAVLDVVLAALWIMRQRPAAALGLAWPVPTAGKVGLAVAIVVVATLAVAGRRAGTGGRAPPPDMLPQTRTERGLFMVVALVLGISWELLYRGFLLWWLTPFAGVAAAVVVAATAYAVAHGIRDRKAFAASLVSALLFTGGYAATGAATGSLWCLIAIHIALPMLVLTIRHAPRA